MNQPQLRDEPGSLYDVDFFEWTQAVAEDLRRGRVSPTDLAYIAEEIADMGKRDRREVQSRAVVLIMHLLKWAFQPERRAGSTWVRTIHEQRRKLRLNLNDSPSLRRVVRDELPVLYRDAVEAAMDEMGAGVKLPPDCPFTPEQILGDWLPE
jgi:hypothetical protein